MRLLVFGYGYSARAFVARMRPHLHSVAATTRSPDKAAAMRRDGIKALIFDGDTPAAGIAAVLAQATHVLVSIAPDEAGDPVLRQHAADLAAARPAWLGYLSTVGVYGDHGGAWVDEETVCRPVSRRSRFRVAAEAAWLEWAEQSGVPVGLFRLSGIYGPGRNALLNLENGTARRLVKPGQVFNRIHVADIAGALAAAAERPETRIYNVTDDEPAPPQDVVAYAARLMGVACPPEIDFATAELSPMARSFYGENKRVSNARLKRELGYRLLYPNYRAALEALHRDGWR